MTDALRGALEAEREARFLESLRLVHEALAEDADDPDALNLLGRLCEPADLVAAISLQRLALRHAPAHAAARRDLARALAARPDPAAGRAAFAAAVARLPDLTIHVRLPWSLARPDDAQELDALLATAERCDPALAGAHAARANLALRDGRLNDALHGYRRALLLEPDDAELLLAASELAHTLGDDGEAERYRAAALARRRFFPAPENASVRRRVLVLLPSLPWPDQVPLDLVVDPAETALHRLYVAEPAPPGERRAPYDVVFSALRTAESSRSAIAAADAFIAAQHTPVLNAPARLAGIARPVLHETLAAVTGCVVPPTRRVDRAALCDGFAFPSVVRPVDAHGGRGFARIDDAASRDAYLHTQPRAERFDTAPFVEYRSADGWYRKYRVLLVGGVPYPHHLAASRGWMVHYEAGATRGDAALRAEEERFLEDPRSVFGAWDAVFPALAAALGLEYVGLDCALAADGRVLVFEADTAMLVHALDPDPLLAYKERPLRRIVAAVAALIDGAARG